MTKHSPAPASVGEPPTSPDERLTRESIYLRQRNAQLQDDITALGAEATRLRQIAERSRGRSAGVANDPVGANAPC